MIRVHGLFEILRHLDSRVVVAALDIELLGPLATVQDGLVASDGSSQYIQGAHHFESQALPLVLLGDGDLLNVAALAAIVDADDFVRSDREEKVKMRTNNFFSATNAPVPTMRPSCSMTR